MSNWGMADTDDESCDDGQADHCHPAGGIVQPKPSPLKWGFADTPPSYSPSALLGITSPRWTLPRGGTKAPRGLVAALDSVETEDQVLSQLEVIMHADDQEVQFNPSSTELTHTDEFDFEVEADEEDSDSDDDNDNELAPPPADASSSSTAALVAADSAFTLAHASTKLAVVRSSHLTDLQQTALSGKACGCSLAVGKGHKSCLDNFSKAQLMVFYCEAQGPLSAPWSLGQVLQDLHKKLWALKVVLPNGPDAIGRKYKVPTYTLLGQTVCQSAWISAHNYTPNGVRTHRAMVLRGEGPATEGGRRLAAAAMLQLKRMKAGKKDWATQWWFMHLQLHDFLPNESAIQIRGAPWQLVYDKQFIPMATLVGMNCCKSLWMKARPAALRLLGKKYYPDRPATELKLKRSANHSRFPECTTCSTRKKRCGEHATALRPTPKPSPQDPHSVTLILALIVTRL